MGEGMARLVAMGIGLLVAVAIILYFGIGRKKELIAVLVGTFVALFAYIALLFL